MTRGSAVHHTPCPVTARNVAPHGTCLFEAVWSRIDSGMLLFDVAAEKLLWKNRAADRLLGRLQPAPDYQRLRALFLPDPEAYAEGRGTRPSQEVRVGPLVLGYSVYRTSESVFVTLLRDITEQRRLEAIAETANLMENIGYVFGGIRHELGNPINTIKMTLSVLLRNLDTASMGMVAEYLERTLDEVARVEYLLTNLKSFTIYESPQLAPVDLGGAVRRFADLVAEDMAGRGIDLSVQVDDAAKWALTDERSLHQVLLNLATNAVDALANCPSPRLELRGRLADGHIALSVRDNGAGMPAEQLANLFRPFHTTKPKGTGLGLVIVKKMLLAMGASLDVASQVDEGTTMTITLPLAPGAPQAPEPGRDTGGDA